MNDKQIKKIKEKEQKLYEWFTSFLTDDEIEKLQILIGMNITLEREEGEDYQMLARENKAMAGKLSILGYTPEQISDICNGAI